MIKPEKVTNFHRTNDELLEFWMFCIFVAGKRADTTSRKLEELLNLVDLNKQTGIDFLLTRYKVVTKKLEVMTRGRVGAEPSMQDTYIESFLRQSKTGKYDSLSKSLEQTASLIKKDPWFLRNASVSDLEAIHGVGPKTARFFLLHSRSEQRVAVLDTHILKWLRGHGIEAPKSTPSAGKTYNRLEQEFLTIAERMGIDSATLDLTIWKELRSK